MPVRVEPRPCACVITSAKPLVRPLARSPPISHRPLETALTPLPSKPLTCWIRFLPKSSMSCFACGARPLYRVDSTHSPTDCQSCFFTAVTSVLKVPTTPLSASFCQPFSRPEKVLALASLMVSAVVLAPSAAMVSTCSLVTSIPLTMSVQVLVMICFCWVVSSVSVSVTVWVEVLTPSTTESKVEVTVSRTVAAISS